MKVKFDSPTDEKKFEYIHKGFIVGGSINHQAKGITLLRKELSILDKLESISKPCECGKKILNDDVVRDLIGGEIELSIEEFDLLYTYIASVPWSTGKSVRDAVETLDWLKSHERSK